jgi:hypothetical protein
MPCDNSLRFDDGQHVAPRRPKTCKKNPKLLGSQSRARMFSLEYEQLLTQCKDLKAEVVTGTEKGA